MNRLLLVALTATLLACATSKASAPAKPGAAAGGAVASSNGAVPPRKYSCQMERETGSHFMTRVCRPLDELQQAREDTHTYLQNHTREIQPPERSGR